MEYDDSVDSTPSRNQRGPQSSNRRFHGAVALCPGLLSVLLLAGLFGLSVHCHGYLLNAKIINMTQELERLQRLFKQKTCPSGWRMFCYTCYLLSNESGTWDEGRKDCKDRGADLVVIDSHMEQVFLSEVTNEDTWIGLNDREEEGTFKWIDGAPLNVTYWTKNRFDNGGGDPQWGEEDCVHVRTEHDFYWNDLSCEASLKWICETK